MRYHRAPAALAFCAALALLAGCGGGGASDGGKSAASQGSSVPREPKASHAPAAGKGAKDPDDVNGDGYRDLVVPVTPRSDPDDGPGIQHDRVGVVFGSAHGLDPSTRAVYGRGDLGLPADTASGGDDDNVAADAVTVADLDGDGFPDFVAPAADGTVETAGISMARSAPYIAWGSPTGPGGGGTKATPLRLPSGISQSGIGIDVRGDFDGDGHPDVAGVSRDTGTVWILYGPFTRSGAPARSGTLPGADGTLYADALDPDGKPKVTALLIHHMDDGEQTPGTLYADPRTRTGREVRKGNAYAFGDFDGDGKRDLAIGDNGSRNDEPGYETEAPDVEGSLSVYPGAGGTPSTYRLPAGATAGSDIGGYLAADPDGDGRDGILVATDDGATLIDGSERRTVLRRGPARLDGRKTPAKERPARPYAAADFDADGWDELVMGWAAGTTSDLYGRQPTHWWITSGMSGRDVASFALVGDGV
ncbi:hypothetical protein ACIREE_20420 [Streptomyces sp. NPDC102467]|uniref:hypothetical protein n=1 Tax=Streptomyces sp. NPDC102467 TaxID=3366179 RepID=UPI0038124608